MAKTGQAKNTKNKAKHAKLVARKVKKKKSEEASRKNRLKTIIQASKTQQVENS